MRVTRILCQGFGADCLLILNERLYNESICVLVGLRVAIGQYLVRNCVDLGSQETYFSAFLELVDADVEGEQSLVRILDDVV